MTEQKDIKTLQATGQGPAPCARFCEATAFNIEIARWKRGQAENLKNQCKLVDQITALTAERDGWVQNHKEFCLLLGEALQDKAVIAVERDAMREGWNTANKLALQNALERDALTNAARLALDALQRVLYKDCGEPVFFEAREAIAALKAVL